MKNEAKKPVRKRAKKPVEQTEANRLTKAWPNWQSTGGVQGGYESSPLNRFGQDAPTKFDLLNAWNDKIYACVSLIADIISTTPFHLYFNRDLGEPKYNLGLRAVSRKSIRSIQKKTYLKPRYKSANVQEVPDHNVVDLLYENEFGYSKMIEYIVLYLKILGMAYLHVTFNNYGLPSKLTLLEPQRIQLERDQSTGRVTGYTYSTGTTKITYKPSEMIVFKEANPSDPYGEGQSPLLAAWQRVLASISELGYINASFSNNARPSWIVSPNGENGAFSAETQEVLTKSFFQRYSGQFSGGPVVLSEPMKFDSLSYPPMDEAGVQAGQAIHVAICGVFKIPPTIFDDNQTTYASSISARENLANNCIKPTIEKIFSALNAQLIEPYPDWEKLFLDYEDVVPKDRNYELDRAKTLVLSSLATPNEGRDMQGLDPLDGGDDLLVPSGMVPLSSLTYQPEPEADDTDAFEAVANDAPQSLRHDTAGSDASGALRATVGGAAQITAMQTSVIHGELTREMAISTCIVVFGFSAEEAARLFPENTPVKPLASTPAPEPAEVKAHTPARSQRQGLQGKPIRQSNPKPLELAVRQFFIQQSKAVDPGKLKAMDTVRTKAEADEIFNVNDWTQEMFGQMRPYLQMYYERTSKATLQSIGASRDVLKLVQPNIAEAVDSHTLRFCRETQETTALEIDQAYAELQHQLKEGLFAGDVKNEMARRVQTVFTRASNERAFTIGATESSRAHNSAMIITAKKSGVATKKRWLLSANSCDICRSAIGNNATVDIDQPFATLNEGPYGTITHPPLHPACRCGMVLVVEGVNSD